MNVSGIRHLGCKALPWLRCASQVSNTIWVPLWTVSPAFLRCQAGPASTPAFVQVGHPVCHLGGSRPVSFWFGSQGRDLKLHLWDLAEGRNAIVDSVPLESMGFCRSSVLAGGQERWMLAMPGRGNDEVSASPRGAWLHELLALGSPKWACSS